MGARRLAMEGKLWALESFISLSNRLIADGVQPVLIGVESESDLGDQFHQAVPQALNLIGKTSLGEMAAIIKKSNILIGHDSGPFHIAVAVHTPVVAICGRSDAEPEYIAYDQDDVVVLTADIPEDIRVDEVYQASKCLLA